MTEAILSSPLESIESIRQRRKRRMVIVLYCAYGDESRDTGGRVYAVAGMVGHEDDWDALSKDWTERLDGRTFHAVDCESDHGDFAGTTPDNHSKNQRLYRDLVSIIKKHRGVHGLGVATNVADYKSHFPTDPEHAPYIWGFGDVVQMACDVAYLSIPSGEVKIVFDHNEGLEFSAAEMYRYLLESKRVTVKNLFGEIAFAYRRTVGIQVADLVARETMKQMDNEIGPVKRPMRRSMRVLLDDTTLKFNRYDDVRLTEIKQSVPPDKTYLALKGRYRKWLAEKGLVDCLTHQIMHLRECGSVWDAKPSEDQ
jgi:hypothetical protein